MRLFSLRTGGVSKAPWDSLNLGTHVGDQPADVASNRAAVAASLVAPERMAICFVGDGGILMTGNELATAMALDTTTALIVDQIHQVAPLV